MENMQQTNENISNIDVYPRRWLYLIFICLFSIITQFLSKSFGTADLIFTAYFDRNFAEIDWICVGLYVGTTLAVPPFAYLAYTETVGFRRMAIGGTSCLLIACIAIILTVQFPVIFPLLITASFLEGVAYCISYSVGSSFAVLWFPDDEVAFVIACNTASITVGCALGAVIPPLVLNSFPYLNQTSGTFYNSTTVTTATVHEWRQLTYFKLIYMFSFVCIVLFVILIYFAVFARNLPPKAPTVAMHVKRFHHNPCHLKSFNSFLGCTKKLFQDRTYVLCTVISGITFNMSVIDIIHLSQFVEHILDSDGHDLKQSISFTSGSIYLTFAAAATAGSFISAKILKQFKHHKAQIIFGTGLMFGSWICLLVSYYFKNIVGTYLGNGIFGAGTYIINVAIFEAITRHTYPIDETMVAVWLASGTVLLIIFAVITRAISDNFSPGSSLISMVVIVFVPFVLSFFLKLRNGREERENLLLCSENENELSPLNKQLK